MALILLDAIESTQINMETRLGNQIENSQITVLTPFERGQFPLFHNYATARFRSSPSPIYNCHGMTFASRRSCIYKTNVIRTILEDDGYVEIEKGNTIAGDVVLYLSDSGEIDHSGILLSCVHNPQSLSQISVLSKWGKYREAIHDLNDSPYNNSQKKFYRLNHTIYERPN